MKNKILMLLAIGLLSFLLAACTNQSDEQNETANQTEKTGEENGKASDPDKNKDDRSKNKQIQVKNGRTQKVFSHEEAIIETVYIQTPVDRDHDGEKDLIYADIMRPKETDEGMKVATVYTMSPYYEGLTNVEFHDVNAELGGKPIVNQKFRGNLDEFLVPRGYAMIQAHSLGTGQSEGCPTAGGEAEVAATKAVIDWLNGRAKAFDKNGEEVKATWSTGKVGMIGTSYNGTLPNAVATTGVEGLETIIPVSAISDWYDYYRSNGLVVAPGGYQGEDADVIAKAVLTRDNPEVCSDVIDSLVNQQDRASGDYNDFWNKRNYTKKANQIKASVFVVHGLNDWNVKTEQFSQWWGALSKFDVPRKLWLHQGGHGGIRGSKESEWYVTLNKWLDYWLYDIENDVMEEPMVQIERENKVWKAYSDWPAPEAVGQKFYLNSGKKNEAGKLSLEINDNNTNQTIVDDASILATDLIKNPNEKNPHRAAFVTDSIGNDIRLSGRPIIEIKASLNQPRANLTALLVDYSDSGASIVTRGWMDPRNRDSSEVSIDIKPSKTYTFQWNMQPDDYVFKEGHKIGLVLISSDHNYTLHPDPGTKITLSPKGGVLTIPIVEK